MNLFYALIMMSLSGENHPWPSRVKDFKIAEPDPEKTAIRRELKKDRPKSLSKDRKRRRGY